MAHAIARIAKLKAGNINASELHVNRERLTPNANEKVANIRFVGEGDLRRLDDIVRERIGDQTIRQNAVLCVEILLTASPEYFRPDEPSKAGYYLPEKLSDWQQAVKGWLDDEYGDRFGEGETIEAITFQAREIIKTEPVPEFTPPAAEESKWQGVKKYLTQQRKLPTGLIDKLHEQGLIYADGKQNAVFVRRSLDQEKITGATLRGTAGVNNTFKGLAKGTRRSEGWFYFEQGEQSVDSIKRVVLVESPIDAMSVAVMERTDSKKTMYLSTDAAGQLPLEFLRFVKEVAIAYDNDDAGELMAQGVKSQLPDAVRKLPLAGDWNEDLVNTFDWSKTSKNIQASKQSGRTRSSSGGLGL
ncbi:MAG: DUF3991 domain-containing protein [Waterburya sp.]